PVIIRNESLGWQTISPADITPQRRTLSGRTLPSRPRMSALSRGFARLFTAAQQLEIWNLELGIWNARPRSTMDEGLNNGTHSKFQIPNSKFLNVPAAVHRPPREMPPPRARGRP